MNRSSGTEMFFTWLGDLFTKHPITFLLALPISIYVTYVVVKFIVDDVKARNKKLGMNPRNDTPEGGWNVITMVGLLFCGLFFATYWLINWIGSWLLDTPNF